MSGAADVSDVRAFADLSAAAVARVAVRKRLVLDMGHESDARPGPAAPRPDNFEGMTLGPAVAGRPTLILVSDNHGDGPAGARRTAFAAFTLDGLAE